MKTMRKLTSCLLAIALAMLMLTACSGGGNSGKDYKVYQLAERAKNGWTCTCETPSLFDDEPIVTYKTSNGNMYYKKVTSYGTTTTVLMDGKYSYTLNESTKTYVKNAIPASGQTSSYKLIDTSKIKSVTAGKTTVDGVEYYSETVILDLGDYGTIKDTLCFDNSGNLKYVTENYLGIEATTKYTSMTFSANISKLTLKGYTEVSG